MWIMVTHIFLYKIYTRFYTGTLMNLIQLLGELLTDNFCFYTNREFYSKERTRMQEQLRQYDDDLRLTRSTLRKEMDWKEKMEKNYQTVLREKREYLSQYVLQLPSHSHLTRFSDTIVKYNRCFITFSGILCQGEVKG